MKHTVPDALLSRQLLCFIRDGQPTVEEFIARFGGQGGQAFHVLRKHGIIIVDSGRVRLSRRHLSPDGQRFVWRIKVIHLDDDVVQIARWAAGAMPACSEED
jgi:hypothetical protein